MYLYSDEYETVDRDIEFEAEVEEEEIEDDYAIVSNLLNPPIHSSDSKSSLHVNARPVAPPSPRLPIRHIMNGGGSPMLPQRNYPVGAKASPMPVRRTQSNNDVTLVQVSKATKSLGMNHARIIMFLNICL